MSQTYFIRNGDWVLNPANGRPYMVEGRDKLRQDLRENLAIAVQPNGFGAGLDDLIGDDVDPFQFRVQVQGQVRGSVVALQRLQNAQAAVRAPEERVLGISNLQVTQVTADGETTAYRFQLAVRPVRGSVVSIGATLMGPE